MKTINLLSNQKQLPILDRTGPGGILGIVALAVFLSELFVMVLLILLPPRPALFEAVLDSVLLTLLISPALYFFIFHPIRTHMLQRERAEKALERSNDLLEKVLASPHSMVAYLDPEFNFIRVNESYAAIDGRSPGDYIGKNHFDLFPNEENRLIFERVVRTGKAHFASEKPFIYPEHPERGVSYWDWSLLPVKDGEQVTGLILNLVDVSDRKRTELALFESERRFRAVFNQTFEFMGVLSPEGMILEVNQTMLDFAGLNSEDLTGRWMWESLWWPVEEEKIERLKQSLAQAALGELVRYEAEVQGRQGTFVIDFSIKPVLDEAGQVKLLLLEGRDITERKQSQAQIQLQATALREAANGIIITGQDGRIQWCNPAFTRMTGYAFEEVIGKTQDFLRSGQHPPEFYDEIWRTIHTSQVWEGEVINRRKDGSLYTEIQTITPVLDERGKTTHFISIMQDVTERKMVAEALEMERQRLFALLDQLPAYVFLLAPDFSIPFANHLFRERFGDPETRDCYELLFGRLTPCRNCPVNEVFKTKQLVEREWDSPDGTSYRIYDYPFTDVNGDLLVLELGIDITARKEAERLLERSNQELRALSEQERNQRRLAEGLAQAAIALNTSLDLNQVFDRILEQIQDVIPCRAVYILLLEGESLWIARERGFEGLPSLSGSGSRYTLEELPIFAGLRTLQTPEIVSSTLQAPEWKSIFEQEWVASLALAPLSGREGLIGFIGLLSEQLDFFQGDSTNRLMAFAAQAVIAIENARSYQAELRAHQITETMREASQALSQSLDLDTVINTLLDYLSRLVPYHFAGVHLLGDENCLTTRAVRGLKDGSHAEQAAWEAVSLSSSNLAETILLEGRSVFVPDTRALPYGSVELGFGLARSWIGVPLQTGEGAIGLCWMGSPAPDALNRQHLHWAEALSSQSAVAIQNAWLFEQVRMGRERLQSLSHRLVEIQEAERLYIARELHDEAGQSLTSLMVGLRLLERESHRPDAVLRGVEELKRMAETVLENLHRLAVALRPASLDHLGLVPALRQHIETIGEQHELAVQFDAAGFEDKRLPAEAETALYRIVQEALTNVVRHSHATRVDILMKARKDSLVVIIEDNGVGFEVEEMMLNERLGLYGMRERAVMLGGTLVIESSPGAGTTVYVEVPYVRLSGSESPS